MASSQRRSRNRPTPTQTRAARRARRQSRSRLKRIAAFTAVGLIAGLFISSLILTPGLSLDLFGDDTPDGPGLKITSQGRDHVVPDQEHAEYSTRPATSGWHYNLPFAPVDWGVYDEFVEDEYLIHNLEHGGIGDSLQLPRRLRRAGGGSGAYCQQVPRGEPQGGAFALSGHAVSHNAHGLDIRRRFRGI